MELDLDSLIEQLEDMRSQFGGGAKVRIAYQPSYPLAGKPVNVTALPDPDAEDGEDIGAVWIAVDSVSRPENPYAPAEAWQS